MKKFLSAVKNHLIKLIMSRDTTARTYIRAKLKWRRHIDRVTREKYRYHRQKAAEIIEIRAKAQITDAVPLIEEDEAGRDSRYYRPTGSRY